MMKSDLRGVITALVTPFKDGRLDRESWERLIRSQLSHGVDGLVVNGTTGESPTLAPSEVKSLYEWARAVVPRKTPVIVGTGTNSTASTVEFTKQVGAWGADAALVVVPYYNRPPQRGLVAHFRAVAQSSSIPILLYNVPGRTVASIDVESVCALSDEPNIAGIKDATANMTMASELKRLTPPRWSLLSGDDATFIDHAERGGDGTISVVSHLIVAPMKRLFERAKSGDATARGVYQDTYAELIRLIYVEANPIPIKAAVHAMGWIDSPELRLPLVELEPKHRGELLTCLRKLSLLK
jgi:4-hydroxy-tetrahydrodipicolinate synthase